MEILFHCLSFGVLVSLFGCLTQCQSTAIPTFRWVSLRSESEIFLTNQEPVGLEGNVTLYLCRANTTGTQLKPGKLWINDGKIYCAIESGGFEFINPVFQVLDIKWNIVSWVPVTDTETIFENAIPSGVLWNGAVTYTCRGWLGNDLIVGHVGDVRNKCFFSKGNKQFITNNFELLIINDYGIALQKQPKYNKESFSIPLNFSSPVSLASVHRYEIALFLIPIFTCVKHWFTSF